MGDDMLDQAALDTLFLTARTHSKWTDKPVPEALLRRLHDIARMGPTSANCGPARFVFVTSPEAKAKLKPWLMDPKNVVGIGNIYSDEICFYAKVRPDRRLRDLTEKEIAAIYRGTKIILKEAIKYEGTSISDYVNAAGEAGAYTKKLKVYQRYGKNCFKCRGQVAKIRLGGRTGSFCPHCQK